MVYSRCSIMGNKPRIRFNGFTEDWEQRKLDELTMFIGDGLHGTPKYDENGSYYFVNGNNLVDNKVSVTEETKKVAFEALGNDDRRLDSTAILMSINGTIGTLARYNNENIMLGKSVAYITPKNINRDFLFYQLQGNAIQSYFYKNLTGTTIKNLGLGTIKNTIVMSTLSEEESTIGRFFYKLDQYITLHQCKLEKLKLTKKALLQKLFPKNGKHIPEIRFKGFTDAWEQRKLGDFYTFKNGLNKEKVYFGYGDSIVNFTDVFHNRQIYSSTLKGKVFVNKKELENFKVKEGDLFFTRTSETIDEIGFPAVVMEPMERVVFSGFVLRGRAEKNDPLVNIFKSYIFFTDNFRSEMKKKSSMTTRALTSGTALKEMYFSYPKDLEEQTKIGEILLRLDNVITLHQRKLERLQEVKKGLLQKMFV